MKVVDYKVIRVIGKEELLVKKVKEHLRNDWLPQGGISQMLMSGVRETSYAQALIKVEKE